MKKRGFNILPRSMKVKHDWGDKVYVSGIYECSLCGNYEAFKKGENFSECQDCINAKRAEDNKWYATNELAYFLSKNINLEFERITSISMKMADYIAEYAGTIGFFFLHVLWFTFWVLANTGVFGPEYVFDAFPFGLLTMIVSLEAIFLSTFILMSQNVAAKKSELRSEHEYQVNLETEKNVAEILAMIKDIRKDSNIRTEHIVDLKEAVEEISEHIESEEHTDQEHKDVDAQEEKEEKAEFEEHEKLMDEIGIDVIPESAPPVILEEEEVIDRDHLKKERKKRDKTGIKTKAVKTSKKKPVKNKSQRKPSTKKMLKK